MPCDLIRHRVKKGLTDGSHWQITRPCSAFGPAYPPEPPFGVCFRSSKRGHSSAGRAPALQAGGRRFDPVWLHHFLILIISRLRPCAARPHNALCVFVVCDPVSTGTLLPFISIYQGSCKAGWAVDQASLMLKNIHTGRTPVMKSVRPAIFIRGE